MVGEAGAQRKGTCPGAAILLPGRKHEEASQAAHRWDVADVGLVVYDSEVCRFLSSQRPVQQHPVVTHGHAGAVRPPHSRHRSVEAP